MKKGVKELEVPEGEDTFKYLATVLPEYREESVGSQLFIVEGDMTKPRIGIRYPGKKLKKRKLKRISTKTKQWANLLDFEVVPFDNHKEVSSRIFNYRNLLQDFETYKKDNNVFWEMIIELYENNSITKEPPKLNGIDSRQFLEMLKWMWIQEDLNYRLSDEDVESKIPYRLENKNGGTTRKGAGRSKFYAALVLVKCHDFDATTISRIIP